MTAKICYVYLYVHFLGPKIMSIRFVRMIIVLIEQNRLFFLVMQRLALHTRMQLGSERRSAKSLGHFRDVLFGRLVFIASGYDDLSYCFDFPKGSDSLLSFHFWGKLCLIHRMHFIIYFRYSHSLH